VIEDGAFFKGAIDIKEKEEKAEFRKPQVSVANAGANVGGNSGSTNAVASYSASSESQGSF
jgi:hypothetical protein